MASNETDVKRKKAVETIQNPTSTHYDVLGVKPEASTSTADIEAAYRKMSLLVHPDKNPDDPNAAENFKKLTAARDLLIDEEKRKNYDISIKAKPETEEATEGAKDEAKNEDKAAPKNGIFKQAIKESDDPMIQMLKEWLNMMVDKYEGNLEGAAWNQAKDVFKSVRNYLFAQDSPADQQADTNTPKPKPQPLSEEQLKAHKLLGLNPDTPANRDVIEVAVGLKLDDLDKKINNCNSRIEALSDKLTNDYAKLDADHQNQQPPMNHEEYQEKHKAIYDQYLEDYKGITKDYEGYAAERSACLNARDVLLNKPSFTNDNTDAPPLAMTGGGDTPTLDSSVKTDALPALEWRKEQTAQDNLVADQQSNNLPRPGE